MTSSYTDLIAVLIDLFSVISDLTSQTDPVDDLFTLFFYDPVISLHTYWNVYGQFCGPWPYYKDWPPGQFVDFVPVTLRPYYKDWSPGHLLTLFLWPCHLTTKIDLLDSLLTLFLWPYDLIIPTYFIDDLLSFVTDVVREQVVTVPHQFQHLIMVLGPLSRVLKWHRSNQHMHYIKLRLFMSLHALGSSAIKMRHKSSLLYTV